MNDGMNSYTDAGVAHAELQLVTRLKRKTLRGIKTTFLQNVFWRVTCCLQYLKTKPKSVVCWGKGEGKAIEHVSGPPKLTQDHSLHHSLGGFS